MSHECCCMHIFSTTLLVEQRWSQLINICPLAIAPLGCHFYTKQGRKCKQISATRMQAHVDVAKNRSCICWKCFIWMLQVFNLAVDRFECHMQHEQMLQRAFFLVINGWLTTFFNIFLMLQRMVFYAADIFLLCCESYYLMLRWTNGAFDGKSSHQTSGR